MCHALSSPCIFSWKLVRAQQRGCASHGFEQWRGATSTLGPVLLHVGLSKAQVLGFRSAHGSFTIATVHVWRSNRLHYYSLNYFLLSPPLLNDNYILITSIDHWLGIHWLNIHSPVMTAVKLFTAWVLPSRNKSNDLMLVVETDHEQSPISNRFPKLSK